MAEPDQAPQSLVAVKQFRSNGMLALWVVEVPDLVRERMRIARGDVENTGAYGVDGPLVLLTVWISLEAREFWTHHDNIVSVESYS